MIRIRHLRFWTVLFVGALCAYPVLHAVPLVAYGIAETSAEGDNVATRLSGYTEDSSVGFLARRKILALVEFDDAASRAEDLTGLLRLTPIAGASWLQLSMARYASGEPLQKIVSALAMSTLTAPNEADVMAARASFGLSLWAALPPDSRRSLISDLVGGWESVEAPARAGLRAGLAIAPDRTRQEIRAALLLRGKTGAAIELVLGLTPGPAAATESLQPAQRKPGAIDTAPLGAVPSLLAPPTMSPSPLLRGADDR